MAISLNDRIAFTSKHQMSEEDKRDAGKKVVTGGGAIAATTTMARTKASKAGFDMFASAKKASQGMQAFTQTTRTAASVTKKTTGLWSKVVENAKWAKKAIMNWGTKFKNMKYVKPILESKVFRGFAGILGYGFGFVTLISGLSDIARVTTETVQGKIED